MFILHRVHLSMSVCLPACFVSFLFGILLTFVWLAGSVAFQHTQSYMLSVCRSIPVKQLVMFADRHHDWYSELSPSLVRLISTLLPELCLMEDWLEEEDGSLSISHVVKISRDMDTFTLGWSRHDGNKDKISRFRLKTGYTLLSIMCCSCIECFCKAALHQLNAADPNTLVCLLYLERQPSERLVPYMRDLMMSLRIALDQAIPRQIQVLVRNIWFRLNTVVPRRSGGHT